MIDTLGLFPITDFVTMRRNGPTIGPVTWWLFGKRAPFLVHDSMLYTGIGDEFVIDVYDWGGRLTRSIRRTLEPREITESMLERAIVESSRYCETTDCFEDDAQRREILQTRFQGEGAHLPAFGGDWVVDHEGNLWVPDYLVRYNGLVPETDSVQWNVFDTAGEWLGRVAMPTAFRPEQIGPDFAIGVWTSELDVESVRRYALLKNGATR